MSRSVELAERLFEARRAAAPITASEIGSLSLDEAYEVQRKLTELSLAGGDSIIGYKVGLTSDAAMASFGAKEPIAGPMFASSRLKSGDALDCAQICDARIEGEILIEIDAPPEADCDESTLYSSIASIRPAIEIADSRILGWPSEATLAIADDACCGWVVVGDPVDKENLNLAAVEMRMMGQDGVLSEGLGANCLGHPLAVYRWFLAKAKDLGWRVSRGDLLLTGALGPAVPVGHSTRFCANLSTLGEVEFRLEGGDVR